MMLQCKICCLHENYDYFIVTVRYCNGLLNITVKWRNVLFVIVQYVKNVICNNEMAMINQTLQSIKHWQFLNHIILVIIAIGHINCFFCNTLAETLMSCWINLIWCWVIRWYITWSTLSDNRFCMVCFQWFQLCHPFL